MFWYIAAGSIEFHASIMTECSWFTHTCRESEPSLEPADDPVPAYMVSAQPV